MSSKIKTMRRRDLWALALWPWCHVVRAAPDSTALGGTAILMDVKDRRILAAQSEEIARRWIAAPGSTIKPFGLLALLENGKLKSSDEYVCPGRLVLNGHSLNCSHPREALPMNVSRAIAYSCNCAVAHFAQRFSPGELSQFLVRFGLSSVTGLLSGPEAAGLVRSGLAGPDCELQALGEEGVRVTPLELLMAYRRLANRVGEPQISAYSGGSRRSRGVRHGPGCPTETHSCSRKDGQRADGSGSSCRLVCRLCA